ncbi:MAG: hypothetical protein ACM3UX_00830 [Candidatus Woesearchaeota archaeon]
MGKFRELEAAGKLPAGTTERWLAETKGRLPKVAGRPEKKALTRMPPRPSVAREARRMGGPRGR